MKSLLYTSPAAGFDHPIEILEGCHERILRNCALVERIVDHVATHGLDAQACAAAANVIGYFDTAGANHHRDEEEDLFPVLLSHAPPAEQDRVGTLVSRLLSDHGELDALWSRARDRLAAMASGEPAALTSQIARELAGAYRDHIAVEEAELFPLARRLLDHAQLAALGASMAARRGVRPPG